MIKHATFRRAENTTGNKALLPAPETQPGILTLYSAKSGAEEPFQSGLLVRSISTATGTYCLASSSRYFFAVSLVFYHSVHPIIVFFCFKTDKRNCQLSFQITRVG